MKCLQCSRETKSPKWIKYGLCSISCFKKTYDDLKNNSPPYNMQEPELQRKKLA